MPTHLYCGLTSAIIEGLCDYHHLRWLVVELFVGCEKCWSCTLVQDPIPLSLHHIRAAESLSPLSLWRALPFTHVLTQEHNP